jgi:LEA14-like dessication related protein
MKGIEADLMLGIKNPNKMGFSVCRSKFDVFYSGIYLGKAKSSKRVHIDPQGEKTYAFALKSDFKNVNLADITKLVSGGARGNVEVKGYLRVGKFILVKKLPVNISEKFNLGR